jgi:RHS repeat-associated protein
MMGAPGTSPLGTRDSDTMQATDSIRAMDTSTTPPFACRLSAAYACPSVSTGKERDTESGNDYFGARYYASSMGRWLSPDWSAKVEPVPYAKLGDPQTLNLYSYVQNNPLSRFDIDGHDDYSYDQSGKQTNLVKRSWWHNLWYGDTWTLNADNGKNYSLNAPLTQLANGQRYSLVSQKTTLQGLNDMLMAHLGSRENHMSNAQAFDAGLTPAPQGIDFKNELHADFGENSLFILGNSAHTLDYIGNVAWGAIMASNGFSETWSHMGAGAQQVVHDARQSYMAGGVVPVVPLSGTVRTLGDQTSDYNAIQQGYAWWNNGTTPQ